MRMIIRIGSAETVKVNIASGGPNAKKAQPKKSIAVISDRGWIFNHLFFILTFYSS